METEVDNTVSGLDVLIRRRGTTMTSTVYRKSTTRTISSISLMKQGIYTYTSSYSPKSKIAVKIKTELKTICG
jgi:hypothetical protein